MTEDVLEIMTVGRAWFSTDPATSAQNYDEFQDDCEITEIVRANSKSILKVDMPHCHPELAEHHLPLSAALSNANNWLKEMKQESLFRLLNDVLFIYDIEIKSRAQRSQIGIGCMLPTRAIWDAAENPRGKIIRTEEIFVEKAQGRADLIRAIHHIIGTVNLAASDPDTKVERLLRDTVRRFGKPAIAAQDQKGNIHRVWAVEDQSDIDALREAFKDEEVVVADGNHRSKAAQLAGLDAFLGVIFCAKTMNIEPYHRMIKDLGMSSESFIEELRRANFTVERTEKSEPFLSSSPHEIGMYLDRSWWRLVPLNVNDEDPIESLDATLIENRVIKGILGLDPTDSRVKYVGGDYDPHYLQAQVDEGRQKCALSIPAVTMEQFFRVNAARQHMPRKTTWFSPKIRSGIVVAELA